MNKKVIYLDNAATTKTRPEVVEAMLPYFTELYGNPSSVYGFASQNKEAVTVAREQIAKIAADIQNEANIETLVKAKGFAECVTVISEDSVSVIVQKDELQAVDTAQILTIVYETTGISPDKVSIINKA